MPPRRARTSNKQSKQSSPTSVAVSTQTETEESQSEHMKCLEMIELLRLEIAELKLKSGTQVPKREDSVVEQQPLESSIVKKKSLDNTVASKNNNGRTPKSGRGCTCKGNCSSKICGCVKKQMKCQDLCKCDDVKCKNQDLEKENEEPNVHEVSSTSVCHQIKRKLYTDDANSTIDVDIRKSVELNTQTEEIIPEIKCFGGIGSGPSFDNSEDLCLNPMVPKYQLPRSPIKLADECLNPIVPTYQLPRTPIKSEGSEDGYLNPMVPKNEALNSPDISKDVSLNSMVPRKQLPNSPDISKYVCLNPMVPKNQLPRSPIQSEEKIIEPGKKKHFSPVKIELAAEKVDWDKHQSELVDCELCKRKFFPHRIDKHVKSCKGI